jgi:hypothetical protein
MVRVMIHEAGPGQRIYVEDWGAGYGSPYLVDDEPGDTTEGILVEDGDRLLCHAGGESGLPEPLAFVDGVRRAEAWLVTIADDGQTVRGLAGAFATGAVLAVPGRTPVFEREGVQRVAIWGSGFHTPLPEAHGGWRWEVVSIAETEADAPLASLQNRMREAERDLAAQLAAEGHLIVLDGPLNFVLGRDARVTGYVKTHHRRFLAAEAHALVPSLALGERTSIFSVGERFSCYARIAAPTLHSPPWSGIIRLDLAGEAGLTEAKRLADALCLRLPRFAGVLHCDPRAPQNLQPIGALETHLRHLMGDVALATRAVRDAALTRSLA